MKIRKGFVSNSSSSSFVIALDRKPETVEEMQSMLFNKMQEYHDPYGSEFWPTSQVAETVFNDIKDQEPMNKADLVEEIGSGWFTGRPDYFSFESSRDGKIDWEEYDKAIKEAAMVEAVYFLQEAKGKVMFTLSYGDDDGHYYSALEHGDLFRNVVSICISHH